MRRRASDSPAGRPNSRASPLVGRTRPRRILIVVVLPAPFGPRKAKTSPGWTVRSSPWSAILRPYSLRRPTVSMAGVSGSPQAVGDALEVGGLERPGAAVQVPIGVPDGRAADARVVVEQQALVAVEDRRLPVDLVDGDGNRQGLVPVLDLLELAHGRLWQAGQAEQEVAHLGQAHLAPFDVDDQFAGLADDQCVFGALVAVLQDGRRRDRDNERCAVELV